MATPAVVRRDIYWAAVPTDELADAVRQKFDDYVRVIQQTGRLELWRKSYRTHVGMDEQGRHLAAATSRDGEQGETVATKVNHARNLSNHIVNLTVQNRLSYDCRARNTDHDASTQAITGQQWMDYQIREKGVGQTLRRAVEITSRFAESFIVTDWDPALGELARANPMTGEEVYEGDLFCGAFYPDDVAREFAEAENGQDDWFVVQREMNVWRLAARYPQLAEEILQQGTRLEPRTSILPDRYVTSSELGTSDRVLVRTLYHRKTPQLRTGRKAVVVGTLVVEDGPLNRRTFPVHRMASENLGKTCFGYTSAFDLLSINDLVDMLYSAAATNLAANAIQNYWSPPNNLSSVTRLAGNLNLIESPIKPEVLELCKTPPELYEFLKINESLMEILSGVNSVARGNPDGALKGASGSALALLQSMTIQFASGLQEGYAVIAESVGQSLLEIFQDEATIPREVELFGKQNSSYVKKKLAGADLAGIAKVQADLGNPATRTFAGRKQIADEMMQQGLFKRPEQYLMFLATGRWENLVEYETSQLLRIKKENEDLKEGKQVAAIITDPHDMEILEHMAVLDDPEARRTPALVNSVLAHVQDHMSRWQEMPPALAAALKRQPFPQPMLPPGAPPPPGGQGPGGPGPGGPPPQETAPGPVPEQPMPQGDVGGMPAMPVNPLTGEQAPAPVAPAA